MLVIQSMLKHVLIYYMLLQVHFTFPVGFLQCGKYDGKCKFLLRLDLTHLFHLFVNKQ